MRRKDQAGWKKSGNRDKGRLIMAAQEEHRNSTVGMSIEKKKKKKILLGIHKVIAPTRLLVKQPH